MLLYHYRTISNKEVYVISSNLVEAVLLGSEYVSLIFTKRLTVKRHVYVLNIAVLIIHIMCSSADGKKFRSPRRKFILLFLSPESGTK